MTAAAPRGMRIGYACINTQLPSSARTMRLANATPERLRETIAANLDALEAILHWNDAHGIQVFRITSNLIPFGSHPVNALAWWEEFGERLGELGALIARTGARISTHPGQYTVLSSVRPDVAQAAIAELEYHDRLLRALALDAAHKIVLHVGSGGPDHDAVVKRFETAHRKLSEGVRSRLVLENDERWPVAELLDLADHVSAPVVFDVFHHALSPSLGDLDVRTVVLAVRETWGPADGRQEVHFSTQEEGRRPGAHAQTIDLAAFRRFVDEVGDLPLDCVLEVKDKEQSVLRALPVRGGGDPRSRSPSRT